MLKLVCFALLISYAAAGIVDSTSCGGSATFTEASIEGCSGSVLCEVYRQRPTEIQIKFTTSKPINSAFYEIVARYLGFDISITSKDGCEGLNGCPKPAGDTVHTHIMNLSTQAPAVTADARVEIYGDNNEVLICRTLRVKIN